MNTLYKLIEEGIVNLKQVPTSSLLQKLQETTDVWTKDAIGDEINDRAYYNENAGHTCYRALNPQYQKQRMQCK